MTFLIPLFIILNSVLLLNGEQRIVGGVLARPEQFPYQVSIKINGKQRYHICGGSLIDFKHVLTAAHCVDSHRPSDIVIWAGGVSMLYEGEYRDVQSITVHEKWNRETLNNDIAILSLTKPFSRSKYIEPIILRRPKIQEFATCVVSGWGAKFDGGPAETDLRYTTVQIFNHTKCKYIYGGLITDNMICAQSGGRDACQGDSGGPLAYNNTLVGIVSFGQGCGHPFYPGVYTNVSNFISWIQQHSLASCTSIQDIQIIAMIIATTLYTIFFR